MLGARATQHLDTLPLAHDTVEESLAVGIADFEREAIRSCGGEGLRIGARGTRHAGRGVDEACEERCEGMVRLQVLARVVVVVGQQDAIASLRKGLALRCHMLLGPQGVKCQKGQLLDASSRRAAPRDP